MRSKITGLIVLFQRSSLVHYHFAYENEKANERKPILASSRLKEIYRVMSFKSTNYQNIHYIVQKKNSRALGIWKQTLTPVQYRRQKVLLVMYANVSKAATNNEKLTSMRTVTFWQSVIRNWMSIEFGKRWKAHSNYIQFIWEILFACVKRTRTQEKTATLIKNQQISFFSLEWYCTTSTHCLAKPNLCVCSAFFLQTLPI